MEMRQRRKFTPEFKSEAVKQVLYEKRSVSEVAKALGLWENSLSGWVERAKADSGEGAPGALTTEERDSDDDARGQTGDGLHRGCIERLIRTLKEQLLRLRPFRNVDELRLALHEWRERHNTMWLIERHGFLTPEQARREHEARRSAA